MCNGIRSVGRSTIPSGNRPSSSIADRVRRPVQGESDRSIQIGLIRSVSLYSPASMAQVATESLERLLREAFPDATELSVQDRTGGGDHFQVIVASPAFAGLPLLEQHRLVNDALAGPLRDGTIHELRIKTKGTA